MADNDIGMFIQINQDLQIHYRLKYQSDFGSQSAGAVRHGILKDYLKVHGSEVLNMILEWNTEDAIAFARNEGREEGKEEGWEKGNKEGEQKGEYKGEQKIISCSLRTAFDG